MCVWRACIYFRAEDLAGAPRGGVCRQHTHGHTRTPTLQHLLSGPARCALLTLPALFPLFPPPPPPLPPLRTPQEDNFVATMTVNETMSFYADIILPKTFDKFDRRARVAEVCWCPRFPLCRCGCYQAPQHPQPSPPSTPTAAASPSGILGRGTCRQHCHDTQQRIHDTQHSNRIDTHCSP